MDLYIADDLLTDDPEAALAASQGVVIGQRLDAIERTLRELSGGGSGGSSYETATEGDIDALFAA